MKREKRERKYIMMSLSNFSFSFNSLLECTSKEIKSMYVGEYEEIEEKKKKREKGGKYIKSDY